VADWAELICLTSPDGELTVSELAERIEMQEDFEASDGIDANFSSAELVGDPLNNGAESVAERNDRYGLQALDAFSHLRARVASYGDCYPFELLGEGDKLSLRAQTIARDTYLFLLMCASLRYVPNKVDMNMLTNMFEHVCVLALQQRLPVDAEVYLFGKNNLSSDGVFSGKLIDKIRKLCELLGAELHADDADFSARNTGDNGLDVVGWLRSGDASGSKIAFFGQCACTHEWETKQFSSSDDAWNGIAHFVSRPTNICYIPFDFRSVDRAWLWPKRIRRTHMVDRFRLLYDLGLQSGDATTEVIEFLRAKLPLQRIEECRNALLGT
jgi:hypothetical protein